MSVAVCIIPAKGASRRIPNKNRKLFHGRPIISYSIATARESGLFDGGVYVSTEDDEIACLAYANGAWVIERSPHLAEIGAADCGTQAVTRSAIEGLIARGYPVDYACCLYPCAPLITAEDLSASRKILDSCQFVFAPGCFYWGAPEAFVDASLETGVLLKSERYIDIDTEADWLIAQAMHVERQPA